MTNSKRSSFVLTNFNSIFAPAPNPKMVSVSTASIGHPHALQPLQPLHLNIPISASNHNSDQSSKPIQDKPYRLFNAHTHKPTVPPRPSSSSDVTSDSDFVNIPPPDPNTPHRSYDHAYEARFRLAARPARLGIFGAGLCVSGNGGGFVNGNGGNGNGGKGNGGNGNGGNGNGSNGNANANANVNDRSRAHQRRALSMKVKVETQNRSSGGPGHGRRGKVGKGKAGKVGFKVPSLVKNLVQSHSNKTTTTTTTTTIIRDAKTFAEREDARALFNYKAMPMSMPKSEPEPTRSGCPDPTTSEPKPTSIRTTSTSTSSSSSAQLISAPSNSNSSSIFDSPVLISIPHPNSSARIPPSRPSAHALWDLSPYAYWDSSRYTLRDEPWNAPESFPSLALNRKTVWTRQIKAKFGGKSLMPSWAAKLESERARDGEVEGWARGEGWGHGEGEGQEEGYGHGGVRIRQPRPVRAWEKELPVWVGCFDEGDEASRARDEREADGRVAWCLSQWQGA
ncbi:uncharacterized protein STEHIDRAFT_111105 [Stereum hirsutum FP-91666 SS1]|uniref:uncharacterized protein n=1 Tax=Stereum hirsutum (strain FP-91666) TaxID=721885 RepID=UPI000440C923|nr:uncharacterized protein STEHIDRAFT_111105 [Stereum hirsutum FP-91666 SS1]EIM86644.1 hypothetical protein STEHIDRAFT_111105 [Stereum hirsutum FP-91666 SS1]